MKKNEIKVGETLDETLGIDKIKKKTNGGIERVQMRER